MGSTQTTRLFEPLQVGDMKLSHRIVMSPLTRTRCPDSLPNELVAEYYAQRATPGGLIIGEGTHPSIMGGNFLNVPGIFTQEHVQAWRLVTDAVHAKGGFIVCQLWHAGRFAISIQLGGRQPLSSSATNTMGNGYLCEQFINSKVNLRTDQYGGSVENHARFPLDLIDAVIAAIGPSKTAIRFSPFGTVLMPLDSDPISTFSYILTEVEKRRIANVCLTQPRTDLFLPEKKKWENLLRASETGEMKAAKDEITLESFFGILKSTPTFATGEYDDKNCFEDVESGDLDAVTFGRWFISNLDLVERIRSGKTLSPWKQEGFYAGGPEGYTDYPAADA